MSDPADAAVLTLDAEKLGSTLVRLGVITHALGHQTVHGTLQPYLTHPDLTSPEAQFIVDLLTQPAEKFIDRWYGGQSGAIAMTDCIAARLLDGTTDGN